MSVLLEVCVDSAVGLRSAIEGGADRIELCSALELGGLSPSPGFMELASKASIPVYAMIRPHAGGFCFSAEDEAVMLSDIRSARRAGLAGVVLGASLSDGSLDVAMLERLLAEANGLGKTLHRAFDLVPDMDIALQNATVLGFERILTSGLSQTAEEGLDNLVRLAGKAGESIRIMPGSGVNADNVRRIVEVTGVAEVHASCSVPVEEKDSCVIAFGFAAERSFRTSVQRVSALKAAIASL